MKVWSKEDPKDPAVYIDIWDNVDEESSKIAAKIIHKTGQITSCRLVADVSGRHNGTDEAYELIRIMLSRFSGFVLDDYTDHLWTLEEIETAHKVENHTFFDFKGWYKPIA